MALTEPIEVDGQNYTPNKDHGLNLRLITRRGRAASGSAYLAKTVLKTHLASATVAFSLGNLQSTLCLPDRHIDFPQTDRYLPVRLAEKSRFRNQ